MPAGSRGLSDNGSDTPGQRPTKPASWRDARISATAPRSWIIARPPGVSSSGCRVTPHPPATFWQPSGLTAPQTSLARNWDAPHPAVFPGGRWSAKFMATAS